MYTLLSLLIPWYWHVPSNSKLRNFNHWILITFLSELTLTRQKATKSNGGRSNVADLETLKSITVPYSYWSHRKPESLWWEYTCWRSLFGVLPQLRPSFSSHTHSLTVGLHWPSLNRLVRLFQIHVQRNTAKFLFHQSPTRHNNYSHSDCVVNVPSRWLME